LLAALACVDIVFVALHVAKPYFDALRPHYFSLEADRGLSELYQYAKQIAVVAAMLWCWRRTKSPSFALWAAFFAFMLYDDSYSVHERVGEVLGAAFAFPAIFGLRPQDWGELAFAAAVGALMLGLLAIFSARDRGATLAPTINLVLLLAALAVCGVIVDLIHVVAYYGGSRLAWILTVVEDGGELVVMSAITAYACNLAAYGFAARWRLSDLKDFGRVLRPRQERA
jgi:hypothetical protein